jgi:Ca-activated chloride channel family protein
VWALVSLRVPARLCGAEATLESLLRATLCCTGLATGEHVEATGSLTLSAMPAAAWAAVAEDPRVAARAEELRAAELQLEARRAAQHGDWDRVEAILRQAEEEAADNPWVAEGLKALRRHAESRERQLFAKEAMYKSQRMHQRLSSSEEVSAFYAPSYESGMPSFLRRKIEQGKRMPSKEDRT